jgi:hypothetical protein
MTQIVSNDRGFYCHRYDATTDGNCDYVDI